MKLNLRFKSVRTRTFFWFFIIALIPFLVTSLIIYHQRVTKTMEQYKQKLITIRDLKVQHLNSWLDEWIGNIYTIAEDKELKKLDIVLLKQDKNPVEEELYSNIRYLLNKYLEHYHDYHEIFIIHPLSGDVFLSTNRNNEGRVVNQDPYFIEPKRRQELFIKDVYYSIRDKKNNIALAIPVLNSNNEIIGIVVTEIDLSVSLYPLLLDRTGLGQSGETLIINKEHYALNDLRWYNNAPLNLKISDRLALKAIQGETGIIEIADYRNEYVLAAYTNIHRTGWGFIAKQDINEIYAPVNFMLYELIIMLLLTTIIIILTGFFISRSTIKPLLSIVDVAKRIQIGELSARNTIVSTDEFAYLARVFNQMADSVQKQFLVQQRCTEILDSIISCSKMEDFYRILLKKLIQHSQSQLGAIFVKKNGSNIFTCFTSLGMEVEKIEDFDLSYQEGGIALAVSEQKIHLIKDIPADTRFTIKSFSGTIIPKEIICIPVIINNQVEAVICLSSLSTYSDESKQIIEECQPMINTSFYRILANEKIHGLASILEKRNKKLNKQNRKLAKQKQEIQQANQFKNRFVSNVSHELKNYLNPILTMTDLLAKQTTVKLSEKEYKYLAIINKNSRYMENLLDDILDLARIEAGKLKLQPASFSLSDIIEGLAETNMTQAKLKGLKLSYKIQNTLPTIQSDPMRMQQILQNIIENAIKYTEKGWIKIEAGLKHGKVMVEVMDSGKGILPDDLPYIFDEFQRGSMVHKNNGSGLGLTIVKQMTGLLGIEVEVQSEPGKGSTFTLKIPVNSTSIRQ